MGRLIIGREIVAEVLRSGNPQPYLAAGWGLDFINDRENLAHLSVFSDGDAIAWQFILRYQDRHGNVPSVDMFRLEFPEETYRLPDSSYKPAELIEAGAADYNDCVLRIAQTDAQKLLEAGDPDGTAALLKKAAERVQGGRASLPFRLLSLDDIDNLPDPEILIDGLIDHGTVTKLVGESGKGKSFVAIDWSLSIATGRPWFGRKVRQGRVLYLAAEGAFGLKKRVRAWERTYGNVPRENFMLIPDAVQLADAGQLTALVKVARDFDVVVIDTLARTSAGLEENSARDMGLYMNNCYKIRDAYSEAGATVLVVHHTGCDTKRARGSSALFANGDGEILIESDDPHNRMTMTVKKRKDGEAGQQLHMHLETVDCGDWTSCVVSATDAPAIELTPRRSWRQR